MSMAAMMMMVIYLMLVVGGLLFGVWLMVTHSDETAGKLGRGSGHFPIK